jgi:hypothetical protein
MNLFTEFFTENELGSEYGILRGAENN